MKKFYSLLLAAVALFGFAACTQDNNDVNVGEKTTMTVYAAFENEDTRMALADNGITPTWEAGDNIYINDVVFTAKANGDKVAFTTTSEALPSGAYTAVYRGAESANAICAVQQAVVNSFPKQTPVVAAGEAIEEGSTLSFKNVASLLQFKALESGDYTFKAVGGENFAAAFTINADATVIFAAEGSNVVTLEGCEVGNTYVVAVAPVTLSEGLEVSIGEKVVKSGGVGMVLERSVIYPLGDLGSVENFEGFEWGLVGEHQGWSVNNVTPMLDTDTENLYVAENVTLKSPGFKFAKHGLANWDGENTIFGAYTLSEGLEYYDFTSEIGSGWYDVYDNNLGEHANNIGVADFTKNYDIYIYVAETAEWGHRLQYTVVEHGTEITMPGEEPEPEPSVPGLESTWALSGSFNTWSDDNVMLTTEASNLFVVKGVELAANSEIKVKEVGTWDVTFGGGNSIINSDKWITVYNNGSNVKVLTEGVYDVYFEHNGDTGKLYLMTEGTAIEGAQDGNNDEAPAEPETPGEPSVPGLESTWALAGSFNTWSDDNVMLTTEASNLFVVKGVELAANSEIKVKEVGTWDVNFGGGNPIINSDKWITVYNNGSNVKVLTAGVYDVYFEHNGDTGKLYLMTEGTAIETAQDGNNDEAPAEPENPEMPEAGTQSAFGVVGSFQGWDVANPVAMYSDGEAWYVSEEIELYRGDEFKFAKDNSWTVSAGFAESVFAEVDTEYTLTTNNGQNIKVSKNGLFKMYINADATKFYYESVTEYTDLTVNITIDNKANWSPLYITLKRGDTTIVDSATVTDNKYAVSGDYIGETLSYVLSNGTKTMEGDVAITKSGATINLVETIIKLRVQLDTDNAKQWWGNTMKIHVWGTGTSLDTTWPGIEMVSEGNYTWSVVVPSELVGKTINYLVHNGNGWQSSNSEVTISAEGNIVLGKSIGIE